LIQEQIEKVLQPLIDNTSKKTHLRSSPHPEGSTLIGEHTDYSEGFVLPVAIDRNVAVAFTPRADRLSGFIRWILIKNWSCILMTSNASDSGWKEYVMGMAWALTDAGYTLSGWQGVLAGNIPIGAGLSSSAALEVAIGKTFCVASNHDLSPTTISFAQSQGRGQMGWCECWHYGPVDFRSWERRSCPFAGL
jgi:galactokinase